MKQLYLLISIAFFSAVSPAGAQLHWESLVLEDDLFAYLVPENEPPNDWMQLQFNDGNWDSGRGGFGYGDGDDRTIVPATTSIYIRKELNLPATVDVSQLVLDIDYDDAFVAYINGMEVARSANLLAGTPSISGSVTYDHEASMYSGGLPERFAVDPGVLNDGANLLAVHVLNIGLSSSDLSARIFLHAEIDSDQTIFHETPSWFKVPISFESSNLPIVKINTGGQSIPDEPKITGTMKVIDQAGGRNFFDDTTYTYNGFIGVEIRGNTSQMFPKKSYTVETRLSTGENNNVSLLGMPVENDWVFHGPYSDKSLMRNMLAYNIGNAMSDEWHPRTRFVELEINGEYRGVYLCTEKIKIDNDRVDIARLYPEDISGDQLTGGYIISIDRDQFGSWNSPFMGRTGSVDVPFSYVDPKYHELMPEQRAYIRKYITDFEYALHGVNYRDPELGYRAYIDVISFIDYFIITELSKDLDGYRVSVYFHKDKDSKGGKLVMTPFWDYNIGFGNANFFDAGNPVGWASDGIGRGDAYEIPFWWDRLRTDPYFETLLKYRWEDLKENVISKGRIYHVIDSAANLLSEAQERNFAVWDVLNSWVWPNNYVGGSYSNEVNYMYNWIAQRIDWIDEQIDAIEAIDLSPPTVTTTAATGITNTSAIIGGFVADEGGSTVSERGLYIGTTPDPVTEGVKVKLGSGPGNFYMQLSNLVSGKIHYIQAYAISDMGTVIGNLVSFTTLTANALPAVATLKTTGITMQSATTGGNVLDDGGAEIIENGFFMGTGPSPELTGTKIIAGSGGGTFSHELTGLEPGTDYHVRAYATNDMGTSYGAEQLFTTLETNVGFDERKPDDQLSVVAYPVPFRESLTIGLNLTRAAEVKVVLTNLLGQVVSMQTRSCETGYQQFIFNDIATNDGGNVFLYKVVVNGIQEHNGKALKQ